MTSPYQSHLERVGLSTAEAQTYLALLRHGPLVAAAIAKETGIPRTGVYRTLDALADKGLIEGGLALGSKFVAVPPEEALPALLILEEKELAERREIADKLVESLRPLAADTQDALDHTVQIVRTPQVITDRYQRMQAETERSVEGFAKAPILSFANPPQAKAGKRGVRYRGLYERAVIEDPRIIPYLDAWIAGGEEIRIYDGELPFKMMLCDRKAVLLTLARRGGSASAMFVRHEPFAAGMAALFDHFWEQGKPFGRKAKQRRAAALSNESTSAPFSDNGRRARRRTKV